MRKLLAVAILIALSSVGRVNADNLTDTERLQQEIAYLLAEQEAHIEKHGVVKDWRTYYVLSTVYEELTGLYGYQEDEYYDGCQDYLYIEGTEDGGFGVSNFKRDR